MSIWDFVFEICIPFLAGALFVIAAAWTGWDRLLGRKSIEDQDCGDAGGWPFTDAEWEKCCADATAARPWETYGDEVTDEHFRRIAELVDQHQFADVEVISGPAWAKYRRAGDMEPGG